MTDAATVVREMYEAFARGDVERALATYAEDVEWDGRNLPDGKLGYGRDAVIDHVARWAAQWKQWTVEVETVDEVAPGVVIVYTRERGVSESGIRMDERHAEAYLVRDGAITRRVGFSDPAEARGAVEGWTA